MSSKATLIFNPVSGQGNSDQDLEIIQKVLSPEMELDIQMTSEKMGADQLIQEAVKRGVTRVIASGGDGTISAVAAGLIHTEIPLGIIPRGTANALASALGIPNNLEEACQIILNGKKRVIDTALCNERTMVLLAGVGFEAETVEETETDMKKRWGILAYVLAGLQQLQDFKQFELEIELEDKIITISQVTALTVANIAPPTSILAQGPEGIIPDDGMLDITVVVTPVNLTNAVAASYHLLQTALQGEAAQRDDIGYLRCPKIRITTNPPQKVVLDGEIIGKTPLEIECNPQSLILYVPDIDTMA